MHKCKKQTKIVEYTIVCKRGGDSMKAEYVLFTDDLTERQITMRINKNLEILKSGIGELSKRKIKLKRNRI